MEEGFKKFDSEKPKLTFPLGMVKTLTGIAKTMAYGAAKYSKDNWRKAKGEDIERYLDAGMRHLMAHNSGEFIDPESNLPHIDHAITSLSMYRELIDDKVNKLVWKWEARGSGKSVFQFEYLYRILMIEGKQSVKLSGNKSDFIQKFFDYVKEKYPTFLCTVTVTDDTVEFVKRLT